MRCLLFRIIINLWWGNGRVTVIKVANYVILTTTTILNNVPEDIRTRRVDGGKTMALPVSDQQYVGALNG